jgi:AraC-like DNA-binding protein
MCQTCCSSGGSDSLGINPKDWLRRERLVQARRMLLEGRQDAEVNRRLD